MYSMQWRGWCYPPELGSNVPTDLRWPVYVFKPAVWNPPVMKCPVDEEPAEDHTYVINAHLGARNIKFAADTEGMSSSELVLMGEKKNQEKDYYMDPGNYERVVDLYFTAPVWDRITCSSTCTWEPWAGRLRSLQRWTPGTRDYPLIRTVINRDRSEIRCWPAIGVLSRDRTESIVLSSEAVGRRSWKTSLHRSLSLAKARS